MNDVSKILLEQIKLLDTPIKNAITEKFPADEIKKLVSVEIDLVYALIQANENFK